MRSAASFRLNLALLAAIHPVRLAPQNRAAAIRARFSCREFLLDGRDDAGYELVERLLPAGCVVGVGGVEPPLERGEVRAGFRADTLTAFSDTSR